MNFMTVKINDKELEIHYGFRALMLYENMTNESFAPKTLTDIITFFYCECLASGMDMTIDFEQFISILDEQPELVTEFSNWLISIFKVNSQITTTNEDKSDSKKKTPKQKK